MFAFELVLIGFVYICFLKQAKSKEVLNDFETEILFSQVDGIVAAHNVTQSSVIQSGGSSQVSEVNEVPCLITTKYSRACLSPTKKTVKGEAFYVMNKKWGRGVI